MIAVERPNPALMRRIREPLGAGNFAQPPCIGRALPFPDTRWHTVRSHVPVAQEVRAERLLVLHPGGRSRYPTATTTS